MFKILKTFINLLILEAKAQLRILVCSLLMPSYFFDTNPEKVFDKAYHPFMMKMLSKPGVPKGEYLYLTKV